MYAHIHKHTFSHTCVHTYTEHIKKKYPNNYQGNRGCYETHNTFSFTHWGPLIYKNTAYLPPEEHALQTRGGPLRTAEKQKEEQRERGWTGRQEPRHPGQGTMSLHCFFL